VGFDAGCFFGRIDNALTASNASALSFSVNVSNETPIAANAARKFSSVFVFLL